MRGNDAKRANTQAWFRRCRNTEERWRMYAGESRRRTGPESRIFSVRWHLHGFRDIHGLATGLRGHRVIRVSFQQIAISYAGIEKMQLQMTKILRRVKQQRAIRTATSYISM